MQKPMYLSIKFKNSHYGAPKGGSSHYIFRKPGYPPITIPKHKPIKKVYIEMVREVVEREEATNTESVKK